ncbi:DUF4381 domain-containing protein [Parahaliea mediterranea]|uniref:DUF4381 domain-containing protein n=1 Tax=Parahaliea mediterranea TaxID=651086 RepID=A0A939IMX5_9GAMM|nr:DUF4381 domain-containing protein [Parahaliea mediterranea]MBN7797985.1 DUF4381 domain-containing protein [Parahaliea mediterranea]
MQAQDPLAQLHPLRQPPEPHWWPPAPGWWLLAALALVALAALALWLWRRHRARRYRRLAVAQLDALHAACTASSDKPFIEPCNRLLKAVAVRSFPRREVAALNGEAWLDFLNDTAGGKGPPLFGPAFVRQLYRPPAEEIERDDLYRAARQWIRRHRSGR